MELTVKEIVRICDGSLISGDDEQIICTYSKDTRTIQKGDCYVGIKGETFDGNEFFEEAFRKGASACLLDSFSGPLQDDEERTIILVQNTLEALFRLAHYVREKANVPVIAVLGSAGKTSTKDMIGSVLSKKYKVLKTEGNLNGQIGMPLTILKYSSEDVIVLEMGMNDFGQIDRLTKVANPNVAVFTNIGTAHIGILGSRKNILKAKLEVLNGMTKDDLVIYNGDNDMLQTIVDIPQRKISYGLLPENDFVASNVSLENGKTKFECNGMDFEIPVLGSVFAYNAMAAYAVGKEFGLSDLEIKEGLSEFQLSSNRMQIKKGKYTIINDSYNANAEAMKSAIDVLASYKTRRVAILGDMLELGEFSLPIHQEIGKYLNDKVDLLITIGSLSEAIHEKFTKEKYHFATLEDAKEQIISLLKDDDTILIKASQGMKLFLLVDYLLP